jgi:thioredoxin-like negative regulator of GroEL
VSAGIPAEPLADLVARLDRAPVALIALGIPRCPACHVLPVTLAAVAAARPGLAVGHAVLAAPEDWALRDELLWPRGVTVSRSSVPALALLRDGRAVARRAGGGPASAIDAWLAGELGPAERPLSAGPTEAERAAIARTAPRRAQRAAARGRAEWGGVG